MLQSTGEAMIGANVYIMIPCQNTKFIWCFLQSIEKLFRSLMDLWKDLVLHFPNIL